MIENVKIYKRALSAGEIARLHGAKAAKVRKSRIVWQKSSRGFSYRIVSPNGNVICEGHGYNRKRTKDVLKALERSVLSLCSQYQVSV